MSYNSAQMNRRERPNILYIMADDHTSQTWGCYNSRLAPYISTPNIDRIASEGALLNNCFCTNSICTPSRATIMTGQYSHKNGVKLLEEPLDPARDNVAKDLKQAGYQTGLFGKWHLVAEPAGFDHFKVFHGQGRYFDPVFWQKGDDWNAEGTVHEGHSTDLITDFTLDWMEKQQESEQPFFCMCHFKATHAPFYRHERYSDLYKDVQFPEPEDMLSDNAPQDKVFEGWPLEIHGERRYNEQHKYPPPDFDITGLGQDEKRRAIYQNLVRDYLRTAAGIDDNIGRLLDFLDRTGLSENTVVIYTSDQGYFLGEHNLWDKRFMLEESLRMPFVIRYPQEIVPGTVLDDIVTNVDFPELFLDYAETDVPDYMQGRSFRSNLRGETPADWPDAMYYHYWTDNQPERPSHYGVRTQRYKLIYYYGLIRHENRYPEDCWEFYDLEKDPHELRNRYNDREYAQVIPALRQKLTELREKYADTEDPSS